MTKQVALANETYARLRAARAPGESFSQAIERLLGGRAKDPVAAMQRLRRLKRTMTASEHMAMVEADRDATRMTF